MLAKRKRAKFIVGVFAVIFDKQGRSLWCLRRDYDLWNLPGGGMEYGETPQEAIIREVKEETGVIVKVERLAGVYYKTGDDAIVFSFVCKIIKGKLKLSDEVKENKFFKLSELPKHISQKQVDRVKDALRFPNKTIFAKQSSISSIKKFNLKKSQ
ncbi:MAG: NUDIX domain-containing protein [Candidatus Magasanikbacteria bacterium]